MPRLLSFLRAMPGLYMRIVAALLMAGAMWAVLPWVRAHGQKPTWQAPFYSGAANLTWGGDFLIDIAQLKDFDYGDDLARQEQYRFAPSAPGQAVYYPSNDVGYCYWIEAGKRLFPWLGDQAATRLWQALAHIGLCLAVLGLPGMRGLRRWGFLGLYGLNPLVLRFVLFNHYYFYQCLPAFALALLVGWGLARAPERRAGVGVWAAFALGGAALGLTLLTRPSVIGLTAVVAAAGLWLAWSRRTAWGPVLLGLALLGGVWRGLQPPTPVGKIVWHTVYIGIAGYPNPMGVDDFSDNVSYGLYERKTGRHLEGSFGGSLYDTTERARFSQVLKTECLALLQAHPLLFVRNAALNTLEGLGVGYLSRQLWPLGLAIGLGVGALAVRRRRWWLLAGLLANAGPVTLMYPPISAYIFGGYVLVAILLSGLLPGGEAVQEEV